MSSLENRIKALLEGKTEEEKLDEQSIEQLGEDNITVNVGGAKDKKKNDSKDDSEDESDDEPDEDDNGGKSDEDEDDETDVEQDAGKKDKAKVNEETGVPGESKKLSVGDKADEAGSSKTSKITAGRSRTEGNKVDLKMTTSADSQEDAGDNAKIKKGLSNKDSGDKLSGETQDSDINGFKKTNQFTAEEHMSALFGGEELSEEFREKTKTIFEAAVEQVAQEKFEALQEEYQQQLTEAVDEIKGELVENIDGYLNYVVEQWVEDNAVALEGGIKVELVNSFIDGLHGLFKEHYFNVPEDKLEIVEEQANEIEELKSVLGELAEEHEKLLGEKVELIRASIIEEAANDLTETEKEKFNSLIEKVEFSSEDEFMSKIKTIKENYFPKGKGNSQIQTNDAPVSITEETNLTVSRYAEALSGPLKFTRK